MFINAYATFAKTTVIKVSTNNSTKFDAVLKDNMGTFKAIVTRNPNNTINVNFEGAPLRKNLKLDYAIWEFSSIWKDLEAQGHKVQVLV